MDKNFLDLRGLTNAEIASLPASLKGAAGVSDPHWYVAQSPVGRVIMRHQPDLVISLGPPIVPEPFEGQYSITPPAENLEALAKENFYVSVYVHSSSLKHLPKT